MGGKTEGKRGMEGDEWRGGEAEGEAGAELVAESGESHTLRKGEQGGCSSGSLLALLHGRHCLRVLHDPHPSSTAITLDSHSTLTVPLSGQRQTQGVQASWGLSRSNHLQIPAQQYRLRLRAVWATLRLTERPGLRCCSFLICFY